MTLELERLLSGLGVTWPAEEMQRFVNSVSQQAYYAIPPLTMWGCFKYR